MLEIRLLGRFGLILDGRSMRLASPLAQRLFAYLVLNRSRPVPRPKIAGILWPEASEAKARDNLRYTLYQLRKAIGPGFIKSDQEYVAFDTSSEHWLDVSELDLDPAQGTAADALIGVLEVYEGELLPGFYDDWVILERQRLETMYEQAMTELLGMLLAEQRWNETIAWAERWIAFGNSPEPAYRALMIAHAEMGNSAAVANAFTRCVQALEQNFALEPSDVTRELFQHLQQGEQVDFSHSMQGARALDARRARMIAPRTRASPATDRSTTGRTPLVAREHELERLRVLLEDAVSGNSGVVLVSGEPGIGKSRLLEEGRRLARASYVTVLPVKCYLLEQAMPYQPVTDLIDALNQALPGVVRSLPLESLLELAQLAPELVQDRSRIAAPPQWPDGSSQGRLFRALLSLLSAAARASGLVVTVDDIHWADGVTLQFLHHLARHLTVQPILLIFSYRSEELATNMQLAVFVRELSRELGLEQLSLDRISLSDTQALLEAMSIDPSQIARLSEWCHAETEGNPFFLSCILQSLKDQGMLSAHGKLSVNVEELRRYSEDAQLTLPEALRQSVRSRLLPLSGNARHALEVASVLGSRFEFDTLRAAADEEPEALLQALEELIDRDLVMQEPASSSYDFTHDKLREVAYHDLSAGRRVMLHAKVGGALEALGWGETDERAAVLAEHFEQGRIWGKATTYLTSAGDRARRLFALPEALSFYDRALALPAEDVELALLLQLHERRGETRGMIGGHFEEAVADLELVLKAARESGDREHELGLLIKLGHAGRHADRYEMSTRHLEAALDVARSLGDERRAADALFHIGTVAWSQGDNKTATLRYREAVDICKRMGLTDLAAVQALHGLGEALFFQARPREAIELFEESLKYAQRIGDRSYEAEDLQMIGYANLGILGRGNTAEAVRTLEASLAISQKARLDWHTWATYLAAGYAYGSLGDYQQAVVLISHAAEETRKAGFARFETMALDLLGVVYQDLNLLERARETHEKGLEVARVREIGFWLPRLQANLAIDLIRLGEKVELDHLQGAAEYAKSRLQIVHLIRCLEGLAEYWLAREKPERALGYANELLDLADSGALEEMMGRALRWRGEALRLMGQLKKAGTELRDSLRIAEQTGSVRLLLDTHTSLARLHAADTRRDRAEQHRAAAQEIVSRLAENLDSAELRAGLAQAW